jgi:hypothetical protein
MHLYLTPAAVGYLTQLLLAVLITGYMLWLARSPRHPPHARWLVGFFGCITLFIATLFLEVALLPTQRLRVVYLQNTALGVALVFLIQFAYRFPGLAPERRREALIALVLSSPYALWEAAYAIYRFVGLGRDGLPLCAGLLSGAIAPGAERLALPVDQRLDQRQALADLVGGATGGVGHLA